MFYIKRDGEIVKQVVFIGRKDFLYKEKDIIPLEFKTIEAANEVCAVLKGEVVSK